ncbi:hypothetical protein DERP_007594 [Dermatophagoides pteronyssinus]|uniref:Uncharacterized protein n=1 Tax=Dermatophagoides pteronyssinus TaxID=6956 RepID=A0ABQ8JKN8_DERPT|nr:hypothetical protein DERP_007594 [Dermatophagoides pteronyssinus]
MKSKNRSPILNKLPTSSSSMYGFVILTNTMSANNDDNDRILYDTDSTTSAITINDISFRRKKRRRKKSINKKYFYNDLKNKKLMIKTNRYYYSNGHRCNNHYKICEKQNLKQKNCSEKIEFANFSKPTQNKILDQNNDNNGDHLQFKYFNDHFIRFIVIIVAFSQTIVDNLEWKTFAFLFDLKSNWLQQQQHNFPKIYRIWSKFNSQEIKNKINNMITLLNRHVFRMRKKFSTKPPTTIISDHHYCYRNFAAILNFRILFTFLIIMFCLSSPSLPFKSTRMATKTTTLLTTILCRD